MAIVQVGSGTPAARAGLKPFQRGRNGEVEHGDVITAINEEPVADLDDMLAQLERRQPGETVTLSVWRQGQIRRVPTTLAAGE